MVSWLAESLSLPTQLDPSQAESVCAALRTWAPVLVDFYRAVLDSNGPPDLASGVVVSFWEQTVAAGYEAGRLD